MKIFTINSKKEWKLKREIDLQNYKYCQYSSSGGVILFHKKGGKKLKLSTLETYELIIGEWNKHKNSTSYHHLKDREGNKLRDKKGKLIPIYTRDEYKNYNKIAYKLSYISYENFHYIINNIPEKKV